MNIINLKKLAQLFKKLSSTCSKCGEVNEYVDDPNFVCYKCRNEAKMFGFDKAEPKTKSEPEPDHQSGFDFEDPNIIIQLANFIISNLKGRKFDIGKTNISDRNAGIDIKNITVGDKEEDFKYDCDQILTNIGFNSDKFPDGKRIIHMPNKTFYVKDNIIITVNTDRVFFDSLAGIIIGIYG